MENKVSYPPSQIQGHPGMSTQNQATHQPGDSERALHPTEHNQLPVQGA